MRAAKRRENFVGEYPIGPRGKLFILSLEQVRTLRYALAELVDRRALAGIRQEPQILELLAYTKTGGSASGTETCSGRAELETWEDLIGSVEAQSILGCSERWIRKIASDLDGIKCGNRWLFDRRTVVEYAEAKGVRDEWDRSAEGGSSAIPA